MTFQRDLDLTVAGSDAKDSDKGTCLLKREDEAVSFLV